jgi:hypothetical protein
VERWSSQQYRVRAVDGRCALRLIETLEVADPGPRTSLSVLIDLRTDADPALPPISRCPSHIERPRFPTSDTSADPLFGLTPYPAPAAGPIRGPHFRPMARTRELGHPRFRPVVGRCTFARSSYTFIGDRSALRRDAGHRSPQNRPSTFFYHRTWASRASTCASETPLSILHRFLKDASSAF